MPNHQWTEAIEAIRVATFEAPRAGSHTEWCTRIEAILSEHCDVTDRFTDPDNGKWRVGRSVGRTIYNGNDQLIGLMDTPELARRVVEAVNHARQQEST
jgi:hypothetical protein